MNIGQKKIIKQGGSHLICLPKFWMKSIGIDAKKVDVQLEKDASLRIKPVEVQK